MLTLPINLETFKKSFLGGDGSLDITSDQDVWKAIFDGNKGFDRTMDQVVDARVSVKGNTDVKLGGKETLKIALSGSAEVNHQIQLIWDDSQIPAATRRDLSPDADHVLVRTLFHGKADASANGSVPTGPLKTTFGVSAGGSLGYERLKVYPAEESARTILLDVFNDLRLPQQTHSVENIPGENEVLVSKFGGYLTVSGQVSYGYSLTGSKEIELGMLSLDLVYKLKLAAGLSTSFRLAGNFELEARKGSRPNFVRYVVKKSRESSFNFAADVGFVAETHLKGLPDTSDEFLTKAFGTNAESALRLFDKAQKFTDLKQLEEAAGKLAKGAVSSLSRKLIGKALSDATVSEFVTKMLSVVEQYNNIDSRIVHLYEDSLERIPQLTETLDRLIQVTSRESLKLISDTEAWTLINRLAGDKLYDILLEDTAFGDFVDLLNKTKSFIDEGVKNEIKDLIRTFKEEIPINGLLEKLKGVTTPEQLTDIADERLQGLMEQLLGKAFAEIQKSKAAEVLKELHSVLDKVSDFKTKYYEKAKEVANRSYSAELHFAFARASVDTALLDVEVDVSGDEGQKLARLAAGGDFAELLAAYKSTLVQINKGVFTHSLTTSTHLQVNLFGFSIERFVRVFQETTDVLEAHEGGLLHVYTTKTGLEQRRKHGGALTASTFTFSTVARVPQPEGTKEFLLRTLPKMSADYDFLKEDDKTTPNELRNILELAELLGIVDIETLMDQLRVQFPNGLGKVSAKYVVRYDGDAAASAFLIQDGPKRENMRRIATEALRTFVSTKYTSMPKTHHLALLGFAYRAPALFEKFNELGPPNFVKTSFEITIPDWFTKGSPLRETLTKQVMEPLVTLYLNEKEFIKRLVELDDVIDKLRDGFAVSIEDLNKAVKRLVEMGDNLDFGRENSFLMVFDRLILEGSAGRVPRKSALVLEITPPGGEKVTKVIPSAS